MKGKTVVVTGGTSGIGEVAAKVLAQMGAHIVLVARSGQALGYFHFEEEPDGEQRPTC
jgi:short-subunit dehydrogenase